MTYKEFIDNIIQTRGQWNISNDIYYEKHRIVPKCMGGEGDYDNGGFKVNSTHPNCIYLTIQEHYDAHQLLFEENPSSKELALAWWNMTHVRNKERPDEYIKIDRETYIQLREQFSKTCSGENNPAYGKNYWETYSEEKKAEIKKKLSESLSGENNPMYGISRIGLNKGRIVSEETKEKLSQYKGEKASCYDKHWYNNGVEDVLEYECPDGYVEGRLTGTFTGKHHSDETKKKLSIAHIGIKRQPESEETRHKKSIAKKGHQVSEHTRELLSEKCGDSTRGTHWYNNGEIQVRRKECPEGFVFGKLVKEAIA